MPNERLTMRRIREVLRLRDQALSQRRIAQAIGISPTTVGEYVRRAQSAGLTFLAAEGLGDPALQAMLFPPPTEIASPTRPEPDWAHVHRELQRRGVTLDLLWQEYKAADPAGFRYSHFCARYRRFREGLGCSCRQVHIAGEKLFVDYAGDTVGVCEASTGALRPAQIFVAAMGASNYSYAEATWTQQLPDWIGAHVRAFEFFGGVPRVVVPDNLKSGVTHASFYDPELNPTYQQLAEHYHVAIIPARPYKPKDKAKVEVAVQIVQRWIVAALRHRTFFSLAELNEAIRERLTLLNARPFKKLPGCRESAFAEIDRPALKPLPAHRFEFAEWKKARVSIDAHIEVAGHYYSVPHPHLRRQVDVRLTDKTVEMYYHHERIASHARSMHAGRFTTVRAHLPPKYRHGEWTPERLIRWAATLGEPVERAITGILASRTYPQQGMRAALGVLRLAKTYGTERLNAACARATAINGVSFRSIDSILKKGLDRLSSTALAPSAPALSAHANVRGPEYYEQPEFPGFDPLNPNRTH